MKQGEKKKAGRPERTERPKTYEDYLRKAGYGEGTIRRVRSGTYCHPPSLANKKL